MPIVGDRRPCGESSARKEKSHRSAILIVAGDREKSAQIAVGATKSGAPRENVGDNLLAPRVRRRQFLTRGQSEPQGRIGQGILPRYEYAVAHPKTTIFFRRMLWITIVP